LLPKDTLNSKIVDVCEFKPYLVYAKKKYVSIDEKTPPIIPVQTVLS